MRWVQVALAALIMTAAVQPVYSVHAAPGHRPVQAKVAFFRDGNVWVAMKGKEVQVSASGYATDAAWSADGKLLAYTELAGDQSQAHMLEDSESEAYHRIEIYDPDAGKTIHTIDSSDAPQWSPKGHRLAYKSGSVLNLTDWEHTANVAIGVDHYSWLPDGSGFMLTHSGELTPEGWTGARLYTKKLPMDWASSNYAANVKSFYPLPNELPYEGSNMIAVYASRLAYSPSGRWLSMVVSPTASWSMDSNLVCAIDADGERLQVLGELILDVGQPKWAPGKDTLAYIAGGGRLVFGFKNKALKRKSFPVFRPLTPPHYADLEFDWMDDRTIYASRVRETAWSNDPDKHPLPVLYAVDTDSGQQTQVTEPPAGSGDYAPIAIRGSNQLLWVRMGRENKQASIWVANADGSGAQEWLKNANSPVVYQGNSG